MAELKAVTDETFGDEVLLADKPVLVDFWAEWCGPCRAVAPVLEELSQTYGDQLDFVKMDTDKNPATAGRYGITSIPSLYVFKGGEVVKTIQGARPKPVLVRELADFIG